MHLQCKQKMQTMDYLWLFDRTCLALMLVYRDILMHASLHPSQSLHKPPTGANITSGFWNIPVRLMVGEKTAGRPITKDWTNPIETWSLLFTGFNRDHHPTMENVLSETTNPKKTMFSYVGVNYRYVSFIYCSHIFGARIWSSHVKSWWSHLKSKILHIWPHQPG